VFLAGFYPQAELWRPVAAFVLLCAALIPVLYERLPRRRTWLWLSAIYPLVAFALLAGRLGLTPVPTADWGGLLLTLVVGASGIIASLPIGILLALGRQSDLPVISALCVAFIELVRAVPLITLLFMASVMLPLFVSDGESIDKLLRALIVVSLFASAYMAEVIRGGLQAIPRGQVEAAEALGLGYWQTMSLIVLPQALRIVIPGIVNTFIGLFKDTTLVSIIGLMDLLGVAEAALQDTSWVGRPGGLFLEAYGFVALVFFVFCYLMSQYSLGLEGRLAQGQGARA
jgi:general L-amino acid transport system permease protein